MNVPLAVPSDAARPRREPTPRAASREASPPTPPGSPLPSRGRSPSLATGLDPTGPRP
nr:MAG TPA: hypothetical protein [Caudoviricetes sp.]